MEIRSQRAKNISYGGIRDLQDIEYIVIHYTGNENDTARGNANYFATSNYRTAGANYFVDAEEIWQSVPDLYTAWSVGGGRYGDCAKTGGGAYFGKCTNYNSVSIELCGIPVAEKTINNAIKLVETLMQRYKIPKENVIRHFDVTGKRCPEYWCGTPEKNELWKEKFWNRIGVEDMTREETEKLCNDMIYKYNKLQDENLQQTIKELIYKNTPKRYSSIDEVPEWGRDTVRYLILNDILQGDGTSLDLSRDMLRMLVLIKRMLDVKSL